MNQAQVVTEAAEVIEKPLTPEALGVMYRRLCDDPCFANLPGKIELDLWGRTVMSPASTYHGLLQARLIQRLAALTGQAYVEAPVTTASGLFVPDVAWASVEFVSAHGTETPLTRAPELCIEVASPSNSVKEFEEKIAAYLGAGAHEVWIVYPRSQRIAFHGSSGLLERTRYTIALDGLFD